MNTHSRFILCLSLLISLTFLSCGKKSEDNVMVLRLAHVLDSSHPVHKAMEVMGERLYELSDGTMRIDIYQSSILGSERENVEHLQLGALDITKVSSAVIENFIPSMAAYSIPYLFEDQDHYWEVFGGEIGQEILDQGEDYWLKGLAYYDSGFRSFLVRDRAIHTPSDLRGLTIRVMRSPLQLRTVSVLGGQPTPMAFGEVYSAIQQGVIDGADGNPPVMFASRLHEVGNYYILDEHSAPPDVLFMSTHTWNRLNEEQQSWVLQAVAKSVEYQREIWNDSVDDALRAMEEHGITIIRPDKQPFQEAVVPLYEALKGSELEPLINRIQNLRQ